MRIQVIGVVAMTMAAMMIGKAMGQEASKEQIRAVTAQHFKVDMLYVEQRAKTSVWTGTVAVSPAGTLDIPSQSVGPKGGQEYWEITFRVTFAPEPLRFKKSDVRMIDDQGATFAPFDCYE